MATVPASLAGPRQAGLADSHRGLRLGVRPGLRPRRRLHGPDRHRRPARRTRPRCSRRRGAATTRASRSRSSPSSRLTGYAIDDLFLQDTAARRGARRRSPSSSRRRRELRPVLVVGAPLRHGNRVLNCAVVVHGGRVLGVAPKSYLPTYREFYERRHFAPGDDRRGATIVLGGVEVPFGPDLLFAATDVPGLVLHVEVCEDMWVPVPPSAEAALAGATVLAQPVGQPDHRRPAPRTAGCWCARRRARCLAAYLYAAGGPGRVEHRPVLGRPDDGLRVGELLAETERFPDGPRRSVADVDLDRLRQERLRQGTFDDNRRTHDDRPASFRTRRVRARRRRPATSACAARSTASRSCPTTPSGWRWTATRPTTSRSPGSSSGCARSAHPKVVIGVSGGLDSTHALIVAAKAMDRLGRPRSDILALHAAGLRHQRGHQGQRHPAGQGARRRPSRRSTSGRPPQQMLADLDHPFADGEPVYDVTFENVQAGLRTDYLFRLANHRGGIVLGTGDLSELALGWCTYGVGDQMSHYARQRRRAQDADPAPDPLGDRDRPVRRGRPTRCSRRSSTRRSPRSWSPSREGERPQSTEDVDRPLRAAGLHAVPRAALRLPAQPDRVPGPARLGRRGGRGVAAGLRPRTRRTAYDLADHPALARGVRPAVLRVQPVQAVGAAQRPQGRRRRLAVAARRLAGAVRRQRAASGSTSCAATSRRPDPAFAQSTTGPVTPAKHRTGRLGCGPHPGRRTRSSS